MASESSVRLDRPRDPAPLTARSAPQWSVSRGEWVVIHAAAASYAGRQAAVELRAAERAADALAKLLAPPRDQRGAPVDIYLTDPLAAPTGDGSDDGSLHHADATESDTIVRVVQPEAPGEPLIWPLARVLIPRWFGPNATAAELFVDGIAGIIAGRIGTGPSLPEADDRVREAMDAGRPVSVFADQQPEPDGATAVPRLIIATSFAGFLLTQSGSVPLRTFLASYDPARRDRAAVEAFHRPLGALEEAWLAQLRRSRTASTPFRLLFRHLVPLLRPHAWRQLEVAAYMLVGVAFGLILPLATMYLVDTVLPSRSGSRLLAFIGILFVLYLVNAAASIRRTYVNAMMYQRILIALQTRMFTHLQRLPHGFFATAKVGDLMSRMASDLGAVQMAIATFAGMGIFLAVSAVAAAVTLLLLSPLLGILVILVVPLFAISYLILRERSQAASLEYQSLVGQTATAAQENLSAQPVIKAFRMEEQAIAIFGARLAALGRTFMRLTIIGSLFEASMSLATTLGQLLVLGVGGYLVMEGQLSLGTLLAFLGLLPSLFQPVAALSGVGQTVQRATGALERVTELLDTPVAIANRVDATALPLLADEIRLAGVSFSYIPGQPILRDLDLTIAAGSTVAIVGPSGCGKSTLLNLLMRFYDPDAGTVAFDGHDLRQVTLESIREQSGLVFQDTFVFDTTLRENIAIGRPEATDAEIVAVAEAAELGGYVADLPTGYDTVLGERGVRMSGGQRQRLAIARALLNDPRVLILDEATSALDAGTEAEIQAMLHEVARDRTTISITHRLASVTDVDRIYVLDRGQLAEAGTFAELVTAGGLFQRLYEEQMGHGAGTEQPAPAMLSDTVQLQEIPLLHGLDGAALRAMTERLQPERFLTGEAIVRQGDAGDKLYLIARGQTDVLVTDGQGERRINTLSAGDYFGEMALLTEEPRVATVRATWPTEVYSLAKRDFAELLQQHPDLRTSVEQTVRERRAALAAALAEQGSSPDPG